MNLVIQRALQIVGSQKRLADICDVSQPAVHKWLKPHHPEYRLVKSWRIKVKEPGCPVETTPIADICRKNWQGYQVHKIFGSARV